jgi:hypothetical protein
MELLTFHPLLYYFIAQIPISEVIYFQMILAYADDKEDSRSLGKFGYAGRICGDRGCGY